MSLVPRNNFFNSSFDLFDNSYNNSIMKTDIYEEDTNYIFKVELPGIKKEDISIDYYNEYINVKAVSNEDNKSYLRQERFLGEYQRSFYVGRINEDDIKAGYKDGILTITVPKISEEKDTKRAINID